MTNKLAGLLGKVKAPTQETPDAKNQQAKEPNGSKEAAPAPAKKPGLAGLKVATVPKTPSTPAPRAVTRSSEHAGTRNGSSTGGDDAALTLDSLSDSEDPGTFRPDFKQFPDETPADKPLRDLESAAEGADEELQKGMVQFAALIDGVYSILDDPEMLGNVIRSIMIELKSQPQYMKLVADDDIRVWIRAMRENMGLQKIAKETKKTSRGKGTSANIDMDMLADLESFGDLD